MRKAPDGEKNGSRCRSTTWRTSCPLPLPAIYTVTDDPKEPAPIQILFHGDYLQPTAKVGTRPLGILLPEGAPEDPIAFQLRGSTGQLDR